MGSSLVAEQNGEYQSITLLALSFYQSIQLARRIMLDYFFHYPIQNSLIAKNKAYFTNLRARSMSPDFPLSFVFDYFTNRSFNGINLERDRISFSQAAEFVEKCLEKIISKQQMETAEIGRFAKHLEWLQANFAPA